jgi:uncharacterized phage protein (TIGR01671 family)
MREIEFRGLTEDKRWVYGSLIKHGRYCCILEHDEDDMRFPYLDEEIGTIDGYATPVIPETVGQYTGLRDKNSRRIFEDDILRCTHCGEIRSVVFDEEMAEFEFNKRDPVENPDGSCLCVDHRDFEVIGNIHDNPELVEV